MFDKSKEREKTNCQVTQVLHINMHLASINIEGITFEISKEMEKYSLFRNMHTIATIVRLHKYCT